MTGLGGYSGRVRSLLEKKGVRIGDRILATGKSGSYEGMLMPRAGGDADALVIKLDNGYNIGVKAAGVKKLGGKPRLREKPWVAGQKHDSSKPVIAIIHTGGTIASRLDYRTGAVEPAITEEELLAMYPEMAEIASIRCVELFQMFSEDFEPFHWEKTAECAAGEIKKGCSGVIITHGTDTMYYTASALSFALQNLPVPVIFTASQRSSDRPSSDSGMNLLSAALFIANSDYAGVAVCMHSSPSDDKCWILGANRTRKMHTSRRDSYRPLNSTPLAEVNWNSRTVRMLRNDYRKKERGNAEVKAKFSDKIGLIKVYPGFQPELLGAFAEGYKGLVIEGYAFGQMPVNAADRSTQHHAKTLKALEKLAKRMPVVVASQVPYGVANMNVYATSRDILKTGVIEARMPAYSAYVKLCWLVGNGRKPKEIKEVFNRDIAGEVVARQEPDEFPDSGMENPV